MTQDDAAKHLGVSRPTFVQIEAGKRSVSSLELDKLAYLFGRDIREFVANEFHQEDSLTALFAHHGYRRVTLNTFEDGLRLRPGETGPNILSAFFSRDG